MSAQHQLSFEPADELELKEFEAVLHEFVARESALPQEESSYVYARYDAPVGRWLLSFETRTALQSFRAFWTTYVAQTDEAVEPPAHGAAAAAAVARL